MTTITAEMLGAFCGSCTKVFEGIPGRTLSTDVFMQMRIRPRDQYNSFFAGFSLTLVLLSLTLFLWTVSARLSTFVSLCLYDTIVFPFFVRHRALKVNSFQNLFTFNGLFTVVNNLIFYA